VLSDHYCLGYLKSLIRILPTTHFRYSTSTFLSQSQLPKFSTHSTDNHELPRGLRVNLEAVLFEGQGEAEDVTREVTAGLDQQ